MKELNLLHFFNKKWSGKGYIGDAEATAATLDSEGWLKTGDLCYFDDDGFLFIVDRLKELIKYKAYQVFDIVFIFLSVILYSCIINLIYYLQFA